MAQRQKSKDDARLAKEAELRIKEQLERAKQERDARLKAEFATKKAQWANQQTGAIALPDSAGTGRLTPSSGTSCHPAVAGTNRQAAVSGSKRAAAVGELQPITTGTMYQPGVPTKLEADPLAKLGERSYLNVIGKAKTFMMLIGILTVLGNGFVIMWISDEESQLQVKIAEAKDARVEDFRRQIRSATGKEEKAQLEQKIAMTESSEGVVTSLSHGAFFIVKAFFGCFLAVGALLILLFFMCETFPRGATTAAFVIYLLMSLVDLIFFRFGGIWGILLRWGAIVALFNGMQAGHALHRMRLEANDA
jgi:hypothetical protein